MDIQSVVRGHHNYKNVWIPVIDEELTVLPEENNIHIVTMMKDVDIVGHVLCELSRALYYFLKHSEVYSFHTTIPLMMKGFSYLLVFVTTVEFICAHAVPQCNESIIDRSIVFNAVY